MRMHVREDEVADHLIWLAHEVDADGVVRFEPLTAGTGARRSRSTRAAEPAFS